MIDFHTHILPGIDDGSKDVQTSLKMLREEARQGIREVVLTPHYYAWQYSPEQFLRRRNRAWEALRPNLTPEMPRVRLGAEVEYFEGICTASGVEDLRIQGTELLLLEMPMSRWTGRMAEDIFELNSRCQVVLAHIERYLPVQDKHMIPDLLEDGVLLQSNVSFFADWKTRRKACKMLLEGQIQFLGSDCHSMGTRRPNWDRLPDRAAESAAKCKSLQRWCVRSELET